MNIMLQPYSILMILNLLQRKMNKEEKSVCKREKELEWTSHPYEFMHMCCLSVYNVCVVLLAMCGKLFLSWS